MRPRPTFPEWPGRCLRSRTHKKDLERRRRRRRRRKKVCQDELARFLPLFRKSGALITAPPISIFLLVQMPLLAVMRAPHLRKMEVRVETERTHLLPRNTFL